MEGKMGPDGNTQLVNWVGILTIFFATFSLGLVVLYGAVMRAIPAIKKLVDVWVSNFPEEGKQKVYRERRSENAATAI
jgi:hypothetical protein